MAVQTFSNRRRAGKPEVRNRVKDTGLIERVAFTRKEGGRNPAGMSKKDLIETAIHRIDNLDPGPRTLEAFRIEDPRLVRVLEQQELLETVIRIARRKRLMD